VKLALVGLTCLLVGLIIGWVLHLPEPELVATAPSHEAQEAPPREPFTGPPPGDLPALRPDMNPDLEVCRSLNTTCKGPQTHPCQDLWMPSNVGWSKMLSLPQTECIIAAQGLVTRDDRAAWIRHCGTDIVCP
jgi:hypothetical protein